MRFKNYLKENIKRTIYWKIEKVLNIIDPNVPIDKLIKQERNYIEKTMKLIVSGKLNDPIEILKRNNKYIKIIDGHHRLAAYKLLGMDEVPVKIIEK